MGAISSRMISWLAKKISAIWFVYSRGGLTLVFNKFVNKLGMRKKQHHSDLINILEKHKSKTIIISPPCIAWNIPLFQRPQHLAVKLAEQDFLYFFCTINSIYEEINGFVEVADGCYVTDQIELLASINGKVIHTYSIDNNNIIPQILRIMQDDDIIMYDYIDEIHEDISRNVINSSVLEKHKYLIKHPSSIVIASSDKLKNKASKICHNKKIILVTNGVEVEHFCVSCDKSSPPLKMQNILEARQQIVGYFGALAKWFDYRLIHKMSLENKYQICLIGWDYDGSLAKSGISKLSNVHILTPVNYKILPQYACHFNVAIIPFLVNEITESTSPIKLFEYMAMQKPIVTTNLPECHKYKSTLVAEDHSDFLAKIEHAFTLKNDKNYQETLLGEAIENSWSGKAQIISQAIIRAKNIERQLASS